MVELEDYRELIDYYKSFVHKQNNKAKRIPNEKEAFILESVAYWIFHRNLAFNMKIGEAERGGPDFICEKDGCQFSLEVVHLQSDSIENRTGLPDRLCANSDSCSVYNYQPDTRKVTQIIQSKVKQLKKTDIPGIVFLGSFHLHSPVLIRPSMSKRIFAALFPREDDERFEYPQISAVLFATVDPIQAYVHGILHPKPLQTICENLLSDIPFASVCRQSNLLNVDVHWPIDKQQKRFMLFQA